MRVIRQSVFETNSSSTHSVCIHRKNLTCDSNIRVQSDNCVHVNLGEFGWEFEVYCSAKEKLSYILTLLTEVNGINHWCDTQTYKHQELMDEICNLDEWSTIKKCVCSHCNCEDLIVDSFNGYIDHQSYEDYRSVQDFLDDYGITLEEFIFSSNVELNTGNDNEY